MTSPSNAVLDPSATAVIDQSIAQLHALSSALAGEIPSNSRQVATLPCETRLSKKALLTLSILLPKLQAIRAAQRGPAPLPQGCKQCGD